MALARRLATLLASVGVFLGVGCASAPWEADWAARGLPGKVTFLEWDRYPAADGCAWAVCESDDGGGAMVRIDATGVAEEEPRLRWKGRAVALGLASRGPSEPGASQPLVVTADGEAFALRRADAASPPVEIAGELLDAAVSTNGVFAVTATHAVVVIPGAAPIQLPLPAPAPGAPGRERSARVAPAGAGALLLVGGEIYLVSPGRGGAGAQDGAAPWTLARVGDLDPAGGGGNRAVFLDGETAAYAPPRAAEVWVVHGLPPGQEKWRRRIGEAPRDVVPYGEESRGVVIATSERLLCVGDDGAERWQTPIAEAFVAAPPAGPLRSPFGMRAPPRHQLCVVTAEEGQLVDLETGRVCARFPRPEEMGIARVARVRLDWSVSAPPFLVGTEEWTPSGEHGGTRLSGGVYYIRFRERLADAGG
ncbi:MAG: hypothetical protein HY719_14900 [Planctomycetes bacterium]|nr:hypothetical protein [Planctomycetota bacterium]